MDVFGSLGPEIQWGFPLSVGYLYLFVLSYANSFSSHFFDLTFSFNQHPFIVLISHWPPNPIVLITMFLFPSSAFSMCVLLAFSFGVGYLGVFYLGCCIYSP